MLKAINTKQQNFLSATQTNNETSQSKNVPLELQLHDAGLHNMDEYATPYQVIGKHQTTCTQKNSHTPVSTS